MKSSFFSLQICISSFGKRNAARISAGWVLRTSLDSNGHFTPYVLVAASWHTCDGGLLPLNKWSHIVLTYDKETLKGYIDGKVVDLQFLKTVAERGSEPARDAFNGAWIAYSKIPELEDLFKKIPVFQKEEKLVKIQKFYAQFETANWIIKEAERRNDDYLLTRGITDLILFGGRLILEHNEILYPFHKLLMQTLEKAPEKPENLTLLINTLLKNRNSKNAQVLYNTIKDFRKWEAREFWAIRFMLDTELAWIERKPYVGDL